MPLNLLSISDRRQVPNFGGIPRIDWSHPMTRGLVACYLPGVCSGIDLTGKSPTMIRVGGTPRVGGEGAGFYHAGNSGFKYVLGTNSAWAKLNAFSQITIYWRGFPFSFQGEYNPFFGIRFDDAGSNSLIFIQERSPNLLRMETYGVVVDGTVAWSPNAILGVGGSYNTASGARLYTNGKFDNSAVGTGLSSGATTTLLIGHDQATTARGVDSITHVACIWSGRILTDAEHAYMHSNPYCFLTASWGLVKKPDFVVVILHASVLDEGLDTLDTDANKILLCSATPTTYAEANSLALAEKDFGAGNCFGSPSDYASGRAITSVAITDGICTGNGTVTCWAAVDDANTRLLAVGVFSGSGVVTSGQGFQLDSFTIQMPRGP